MGMPVVTVAAGGLPVVESTNGFGTPVTEATNGRGVAVTKVIGKPGLPVIFETFGAAPLVPTTWNLSDKTANVTLSNGSLTATSSGVNGGVRGVKGVVTGKFYWEATVVNQTNINTAVGVALGTATLGTSGTTVAILRVNGAVLINNVTSGTISSLSNGSIVGIATDIGAQLIWFKIAPAGAWNPSGTGDPATGSGGLSLATIAGTLFPCCIMNAAADAWTSNFGGSAFSGAVPSGFTAGWPT